MTTRKSNREKPLTIEQANEMAVGHAEVSVDPVDATLWQVQGDGWTETHEPMGRAAFARLLADKCLSHDGSGCGEGSRAKAISDAKRCPTTHSGKGLHQRIVDVGERTFQCLFCNEVYRLPAEVKTYDAGQGRGRVTVPEDPTPDEVLFDAIKDNFSPEAVAAMAAYLQAANTKNRRVNQQLTWFASQLVEMLGTAGYSHLLEEVGL